MGGSVDRLRWEASPSTLGKGKEKLGILRLLLLMWHKRLIWPQGQVGWGFEQPGLMEGVLPIAGGWNEMTFKVHSNPNHSMIL